MTRQLSVARPTPTLSSRERVRNAGVALAAAVQRRYPDVRIDIDTETVDGEDALSLDPTVGRKST